LKRSWIPAQAGDIKFDPFAHVSELRANRKIEAIKLYRQATGVQRRAGMS